MASHECPVGTCQQRVSPAMLMCRSHWRMVSKPLQNAVYAAWDNGQGAGTLAHRAAILAAIRAVDAKLADTPL